MSTALTLIGFLVNFDAINLTISLILNRLRYTKDTKQQIVKKYKTVYVCCEGYVENTKEECIRMSPL